MPAVSKAKRQRIDAGKNSCDVRSKEKENNEENETWKRKQQEVPKAMVMMYTDNSRHFEQLSMQNMWKYRCVQGLAWFEISYSKYKLKYDNLGSQLVTPTSMTGVITNLLITCKCGKKVTSWSAPEKLNNAVVMGSKLTGITMTQLERFLLNLNFVAEGKSITYSNTLFTHF